MALVLALFMALGLAGCSGEDDTADTPEADATRSESFVGEAPGIRTRVEVGEIVGRLPKRPATAAAAEVAEVVDDWIDGAYVGGDYPRNSFGDAFAGFTDGASRLAADQSGLLSNAVVGEKVDTVTATRRVVRVDLLAPKGKLAGATAHVNLVFDLSGDVDRTDQVRGRLLLTHSRRGWQVFGFDIERGEVKG
ncbi:hypothetical protein [Nocardioides stalactiti]|uniref:hypothetical protein n=1 Tax=Nocardioides stalactiti TaxID=2755356 RepID=UPI0016006844|nr:hypothetical protein [Nocardioides stalactiti]